MWRVIFKAFVLLLGCALAASQLFVMAFALYALIDSGKVGFAVAIGYGAICFYAVPLFFLWLVLTRFFDVGFRTRLPNYLYLGSHLLIILSMILFPGAFGV
ncbi:hypothetical protein RB24_02250 [Herbaspirillum rubrisubalbicans]|uniref:Uncharacterized protein n=1 Tax=Herbaspirillum rubrisubalbicans TaxID=80842 RepID=A0ABX9C8F5_9BURK|nr:hypothetical protein RB24_02250 [Herbaspirillum rubrisubalbicans]